MTRLSAILTITLFGASLLNGCAVTNRDNRILLNSLDRATEGTVVSDTVAGRVVAAPLFVPAGIAATAIDMAVITPARATRPAWNDTRSCLWDNPQGSELRQAMLLMPKTAATPLVFATDWVFRSLFATDFRTERR